MTGLPLVALIVGAALLFGLVFIVLGAVTHGYEATQDREDEGR